MSAELGHCLDPCLTLHLRDATNRSVSSKWGLAHSTRNSSSMFKSLQKKGLFAKISHWNYGSAPETAKKLAFACENFITSCSSPQTPAVGKGQPFGFWASSSVGQVHDVLYNLVNFVDRGGSQVPKRRPPASRSDTQTRRLHHVAVRPGPKPNQWCECSPPGTSAGTKEETCGAFSAEQMQTHQDSRFHKISKARLPNPEWSAFKVDNCTSFSTSAVAKSHAQRNAAALTEGSTSWQRSRILPPATLVWSH